jgi:hypothetical protein
MASTISAGTTSGTAIAIAGDTSGALALQTNNGTTAVTIDTSQNVGIGTATPTNKLTVTDSVSSIVAINATTRGGVVRAQQNGTTLAHYGVSGTFLGDTSADAMVAATNNVVFHTNNSGTERMRITSAGKVVIGGTTAGTYWDGPLTVTGTNMGGKADGGFVYGAETLSGTTFGGLGIGASYGAAGVGDFNLFLQANAGKRIYVQNRSAGVYLSDGGTSWTSNSDERIKKNLVPIEDAVNKVSQLRTVIGEYIDDELERKRPFLIAQDVDKVLPEAVDKTKEDVWGIQYADVIPLLTAAIQELNAKVEAQATTIAELQAKVGA